MATCQIYGETTTTSNGKSLWSLVVTRHQTLQTDIFHYSLNLIKIPDKSVENVQFYKFADTREFIASLKFEQTFPCWGKLTQDMSYLHLHQPTKSFCALFSSSRNLM